MDLQLTGRHVLITGGSKGIGLACAQGFLREGARVVIMRDQLTVPHIGSGKPPVITAQGARQCRE